jgi:Transposase DDE domain
MLATELLFVYVYCLVDDAIKAGPLRIPRRPGPAPACTDAELLAIALVRHLLGRRSENGFLAEIRRDWLHLFPRLPGQSEVNRRTRWLWGAFEQLRVAWAASVPADPVQQIDTSALPVKHCSRVRGPDQWTGPGNDLAARFGRDGAHAEWFYGFRLAVRTDLGRRIVRAWSIVPAAVNERDIGTDLVCGDAAMIDALLLDKGFNGSAFAAEMAAAGIEVMIPPTRAQRRTMPKLVQRLIARFRNRVEASFKEITDQMELARHGAHCFEGLLTRTATTLAAHALLLAVSPDMG